MDSWHTEVGHELLKHQYVSLEEEGGSVVVVVEVVAVVAFVLPVSWVDSSAAVVDGAVAVVELGGWFVVTVVVAWVVDCEFSDSEVSISTCISPDSFGVASNSTAVLEVAVFS